MARTHAWSEATPDGSVDDISTIDNAVRRLRLELREIVNQVIGVAEATALADPIQAAASSNATLRSELTTAQTNISTLQTQNASKSIVQVFPAGCAAFDPDSTFTLQGGAVVVASGTPNGFMYLPIPVGAVITEALVNAAPGTGAFTAQIHRIEYGASSSGVALGNVADANGEDMVGADITVESGYGYYINFTVNAGGGAVTIYSVKITYTSASPAVRL